MNEQICLDGVKELRLVHPLFVRKQLLSRTKWLQTPVWYRIGPILVQKKQGDNALIVAAENIIGKKGSVLKKLLRIQ